MNIPKNKRCNFPKTFLIVLIIVITTAACVFFGPQPQNTPTPMGEPETQGDSRLKATLSAPKTVPLCTPVELVFTVTNQSDQAVYLLNWYTPLEGIFGDIFQVTYAGQELLYLGPQVMRDAPLPEQYTLLAAGESATAVVDLSTAYDFSTMGHYSIAFKSPQISHLVENTSDFSTSVEELGPVQISSQPVEVEIVLPENGAEDCATNAAAPPAATASPAAPGESNNPDFTLITLTGIVKEVSPSARIIWLQAAVEGFATLALTADSTITKSSGERLELAQIHQGLTVKASGQPGEDQTLLVYSVQVIPPVKPTAITDIVVDPPSELNPNSNQASPKNVTPAVTPSGPQGYLIFPFQSADAGNFILPAGDEIVITWEQAPPRAESYAFIYTGSEDGASQTIGSDADGRDGVTTTMTVPPHLHGQFVGLARLENGDQIWSASSTVYSGKLPPANVCSLRVNGVGVVNVYRKPEVDSPRFAYLTPGTYATVIKKIDNDWYLIDASAAINSTENIAAQGEGWVNAGNSSISLHGSCEDIPNGE